MGTVKGLAQRFWDDESGLELSEYAIMIALVIVIAVVTIGLVGQRINEIFQELLKQLSGSTGG